MAKRGRKPKPIIEEEEDPFLFHLHTSATDFPQREVDYIERQRKHYESSEDDNPWAESLGINQ